MAPIEEYAPMGKWLFDKDTTDIFDDMLIRSIPQYEVMRKAVDDLVERFYIYDMPIIDIGCSRGEAISRLLDRLSCNFIGLEISDPMIAAATDRYKDNPQVDIRKWDLRLGLPPEKPAAYLSILTLQFIPINYRQQLIEQMYNNLPEGGVLILVEKILGKTAILDSTFVNLYHTMKGDNGYTEEEIVRKSLALEGVLVPVTAEWNEDLLKQAGFKVDCFWRWMNFAGWVGYK